MENVSVRNTIFAIMYVSKIMVVGVEPAAHGQQDSDSGDGALGLKQRIRGLWTLKRLFFNGTWEPFTDRAYLQES